LPREHRGDGDIAALMIEGVGGLDTHVLFGLDMSMPVEKLRRIHADASSSAREVPISRAGT